MARIIKALRQGKHKQKQGHTHREHRSKKGRKQMSTREYYGWQNKKRRLEQIRDAETKKEIEKYKRGIIR